MTGIGVASIAWLNLIFPRSCVACGAAADLLCARCREDVRALGPPWCERCGAPTAWPVTRCRECSGREPAFVSARAAVAYAGPVPALVRAWKERALRHVVDLAVELVTDVIERPAADVISYIPGDPGRQLTRAGHPATALARGLGERWSLPYERLVLRTRPVPRQTGLPLDARRRNVRDAFAADDAALRGGGTRVVLVDDVYTTGATVSAAAAALLRAGAVEVRVVTFARALR